MRIRRSTLTTPGDNPSMLRKAAETAADEVLLDLEDSVIAEKKVEARTNVIQALQDGEWNGKTVAVRINNLDNQHWYRDVIEIVETAGENLDAITIPKVSHAADVYAVLKLLKQVETSAGIEEPIGIEVLIETTAAIQEIDDIAGASSRLEALVFGSGDYSVAQGVTTPERANELYDDVWYHARNRILIAARSNDLAAIDGPYGDINDQEGFREQCIRAQSLGFDGKWVIHPSQIETANEVFSPSQEEVERAREIIATMEEAREGGRGAAEFDGQLLDDVSIRRAQRTLALAEQTERRE